MFNRVTLFKQCCTHFRLHLRVSTAIWLNKVSSIIIFLVRRNYVSHCWLIVYTLGPRQNGRHITDDIFKCILLNKNVWVSIKISLKFVPKGPINNIPSLVQIMAWRRPGDELLSEPMMLNLPTYIWVTRPQWVNWTSGDGIQCWSKCITSFMQNSSRYTVCKKMAFSSQLIACMTFISATMSVESFYVTWFKCDEQRTIVWSCATYAHLIHKDVFVATKQ